MWGKTHTSADWCSFFVREAFFAPGRMNKKAAQPAEWKRICEGRFGGSGLRHPPNSAVEVRHDPNGPRVKYRWRIRLAGVSLDKHFRHAGLVGFFHFSLPGAAPAAIPGNASRRLRRRAALASATVPPR